MKGVELAGRFVIGVRPDGTLIVGEKPVDGGVLVAEGASPSKWEDRLA